MLLPLSLGNNPLTLEEILKGSHPIVSLLKNASHPMLIVGQDLLTREDGDVLLGITRQLAEKYEFIYSHPTTDYWNGFNVLHTAASRVGGLDLGFTPDTKGNTVQGIIKAAATKKLKAIYLLGADELDMSCFSSTFVIYQGHHGDQGAAYADIILPGAAYTEKAGTYVNTEGRVQQSFRAVFPPGQAQEDWKIICTLAQYLKINLPYSTQEGIGKRLADVNSSFEELDTIPHVPWLPFGKKGTISPTPLLSQTTSFYMTDPISRHSVTMAKCQEAQKKRKAL